MLNRRALALHLALNELGCSLKMGDFSDRLSMQKTVHLIQGAGVHLGFGYNWYIHGPYSPALTEEAFGLLNEQLGDPSGRFADGWALDTKSKGFLKSLKVALENLPNGEVERPRQLEIVSSVLWALQRAWAPWNRPSLVFQQLVEKGKKDFTLEQVRNALSWLKKYALLPKAES